jgi:hypothetical protein
MPPRTCAVRAAAAPSLPQPALHLLDLTDDLLVRIFGWCVAAPWIRVAAIPIKPLQHALT